MVALVVLTVLALAVVVGALIKGGAARGSRTAATALRWAALLLVLAGAGVSLPHLLDDENWAVFNVLVLAVPVILAAIPVLVVDRRAAVSTTWACAIVLVILAVLFGLGIGMFMLPGAFVLLVAAGVAVARTGREGSAVR